MSHAVFETYLEYKNYSLFRCYSNLTGHPIFYLAALYIPNKYDGRQGNRSNWGKNRTFKFGDKTTRHSLLRSQLSLLSHLVSCWNHLLLNSQGESWTRLRVSGTHSQGSAGVLPPSNTSTITSLAIYHLPQTNIHNEWGCPGSAILFQVLQRQNTSKKYIALICLLSESGQLTRVFWKRSHSQ